MNITDRHPSDPPMAWSARFAKAYRRGGAALQGLVESTIHDLARRWRAGPATCFTSYDRVQHLRNVADILEIKVGGARRLLAYWDGAQFVLLALGEHDLVASYNAGHFLTDQLTARPAPPQFWPDFEAVRLFARNPAREFMPFGNELTREWLYFLFLSDQQTEVVHDVVNLSEHVLAGEGTCVIFILGGPGTGKTSILINLLKEFAELGYATRINVPEHVAKYIAAALPELDLEPYTQSRSFVSTSGMDVLLVDDPANSDSVLAHISGAIFNKVKLVVCAFDPCQLTDPVADETLRSWVRQYKAHVFALDQCYRQKENVGVEVKRVIDTVASSTPFLAAHKMAEFRATHMGLTELSNSLTFPNPYGYLEVYENFTIADVTQEMVRIRQHPLWAHWPPLLVVIDENLAPTQELLDQLGKVNHERVGLRTSAAVKGIEFQHVFVILTGEQYRTLEHGFRGTGRSAYNQWRLLRIPFSRAKDSLVIFINAD